MSGIKVGCTVNTIRKFSKLYRHSNERGTVRNAVMLDKGSIILSFKLIKKIIRSSPQLSMSLSSCFCREAGLYQCPFKYRKLEKYHFVKEKCKCDYSMPSFDRR